MGRRKHIFKTTAALCLIIMTQYLVMSSAVFAVGESFADGAGSGVNLKTYQDQPDGNPTDNQTEGQAEDPTENLTGDQTGDQPRVLQDGSTEDSAADPAGDPPAGPEAKSGDMPAVPVIYDAVVSTTSVALTWTAVPDVSGYDLEADGDVIPDIPETSYIHSGLEPGTAHTYRVRAKNSGQAGEWSAEKTVTTAVEEIPRARLRMFNADRRDNINSINPRFELIHAGTAPIKLSDVKIRYYFKVEGTESLNFWCDWASIGKENVAGTFMRLEAPKKGADYCLDIGFTEDAGELQPGGSAQIQVRFANTEWSSYLQTNDYSFNSTAGNYVDWDKVVVYIENSLAWGEEPSIDAPAPEPLDARLEMYNGNRTRTINTVFPWYRLYNTGSQPISLSDVRIRYYYTADGECEQNFWCDWTPIGNGKVTGRFLKMSAPIDTADTCFEMGFADAAGMLLPGGYLEIQSRFAKKDWSDFSQDNDYSFNSSSVSYISWEKVTVYIGDDLVWGNEIMLEVPENITASTTETEISLSWEAMTGATGYDVEADGVPIDVGTATAYTAEGFQPGTLHQFKIRAKSNLTSGKWSDTLDVWTLPDIPGNISVSSGNQSILITWDAVPGATGYNIEVYGTAIDNGAATSYTHTGLNPNLQQTYRIRAKNASGAGKWSGIAAGVTLPGVPANLRAAAFEDSIVVTWDAVAGATGYDVEADGELVTDISAASYRHTGLQPDTSHAYRVRAKNADGTGEWSSLLSESTLLPVPPNIRITVKSTEIILAWDAVTIAESYDIEADGVIINNGNNLTMAQEGLTPGTEHTYRVRAVKGDAESAWSAELSRLTLPGIPENIIADASGNTVTVSWDPAQGADGYDIEADGVVLDNGMKTVYLHTGLTADISHSYRVRAKNSAGAGEWSVRISLSESIPAPAGLKTLASSTTIALDWEAVSGASGYDLLADGEVIDAGTDAAYTHRGLAPNSVHVYRVRTRKAGGVSGWSGAVTGRTMVGVPSGLKATSKKDEITVTWNKVESASAYEVEADGTIIDTGDQNTYIHKGLETGTLHSYRVRAGNGNGMGDWSETITKSTAPPAPENLRAEAGMNEIELFWDACTGAEGYELEVDGVIAEGITELKYIHSGLEPNTRHAYRVRAVYEDDVSGWSESLEVTTKSELILEVAKDTMFNFVAVVPVKEKHTIRTITVEFNPDELEIVDLCANTPGLDTEPGAVEGTHISVVALAPGRIAYEITNADKTVMLMIRFLSKTNDHVKMSYRIE